MSDKPTKEVLDPTKAARAGAVPPAGNGAKPATNGAKPAAAGAKPAANGAKPAANGAKPAANGAKPATNGAKPTANGAAANGAAAQQRPAAPATGKPGAAPATKAAAAQAAAEESPEEEEVLEEAGHGFFSKDTQNTLISSAVSLVVCASCVLGLGMAVIETKKLVEKLAPPLEVPAPVEEDREDPTMEVEPTLEPSDNLEATVSTSPSQVIGAAGTVAAVSAPETATETLDIPSDIKVEVSGSVDVFKSSGTEQSQAVPEGSLGEAVMEAETYQQAMDLLTQEILQKLAKGKVCVIWCFDQSESMKDDRGEIMGRIARVYQELQIAESAKGDALVTGVCSYGAATMFHTNQPTSVVEDIQSAMMEVPTDESGKEEMCQAIGESIQRHSSYRTKGGRQLMLVLVTDESGEEKSNYAYLEPTIDIALQNKCPIYTLGREAVFGYQYANMRWEDPKTGLVFWLPINRGPETPQPECLQVDGLHRRWDALASGFGPYEQARMARRTNGIFFKLPSPEVNLVGRDNTKYSSETMRPYLPDLSARDVYVEERDKKDFRRLLFKIISDLNPWQSNGKKVEVRIRGFPIVPADFNREAQQQLQIAIAGVQYYKAAQVELEKVKADRNREESPRWRANYDLMLGQVIAAQVRMYEYGAYLEAFMKNPKPIKNVHGPKRPTTNWDINYTKKLVTGDKFKKEMAEATAIFEQIIKEHYGTPYANRAQWEINRGFGVDLHEDWWDPKLAAGVKRPSF